MKALLVLLIFSGLSAQSPTPTPKPPQPTQKFPIAITANCTDQAGELFLYHLREEIRNSSGYSLESTATTTISLICLDDSVGGSGYSSAVSVLVTGNFQTKDCNWLWIVQHQVLNVGREATKAMAARLMASIDNSIHTP